MNELESREKERNFPNASFSCRVLVTARPPSVRRGQSESWYRGLPHFSHFTPQPRAFCWFIFERQFPSPWPYGELNFSSTVGADNTVQIETMVNKLQYRNNYRYLGPRGFLASFFLAGLRLVVVTSPLNFV